MRSPLHGILNTVGSQILTALVRTNVMPGEGMSWEAEAHSQVRGGVQSG